jgi:beta-lactamase class D OXA-50
MKIPALMFGLMVAFGPASASASDWRDSATVARLFKEAGVSGTFVLYDVAADRYTGHDRARAETRYIPASTFKIPNTLIGLTVGSVADVDQVLPYGGKPQRLKVWEQDMNLRDAIKVSNVPVYQELARRTGLTRMREHVARLDYGNRDIGTVVDNFWLVGPLKISAVEQTRFLARLAQDTLPFPKPAMALTRDIALTEKTDAYSLYAKTGWSDSTTPDIGWWTGWVQKGGRTYAFAMNIDIMDDADAQKRVPLGKASLAALGVISAPLPSK